MSNNIELISSGYVAYNTTSKNLKELILKQGEDHVMVYVSYNTIVAFDDFKGNRVQVINSWGTVTGKHLNYLNSRQVPALLMSLDLIEFLKQHGFIVSQCMDIEKYKINFEANKISKDDLVKIDNKRK
jgi:hypothetical protein